MRAFKCPRIENETKRKNEIIHGINENWEGWLNGNVSGIYDASETIVQS